MLFLNVSRIRTPHEHFEEVYPPGAFATNQEAFSVVEPVALVFDVDKGSDKDTDRFRLAGRVRTRLELPCSRCLEPFSWPVDAAFDLRYQPHGADAGEGEKEIAEDDLTTAFYENDTIDLDQLVREQLYLSLPMKPLCRDDCRGLCPICGTNLNRGACTCTPDVNDPRLAVLKSLKSKITH
jgi:uncharacterized protein